MPMFVKKPVVIEAVQFEGQPIEGVCTDKACSGFRRYRSVQDCSGFILPHIHTLEGVLIVSEGDWIITGVNGEKYPCKPDIFEKTYEAVQ